MRVLVLGATGYIGSAVTERLGEAGHQVVALSRHRGHDPRLSHVHQVRWGDIRVPGSLTAAVTPDIDAVVHVSNPTGDAAVDAAAVAALVDPLRGTGRALLYTSGVWVLGATGAEPVDEAAPTKPIELVLERPEIERQVLAAAADGVRGIVLRPGIAHGRGSGIPALLVELARSHGGGRYVGAPVRWPMVQLDDLADLYVRALERADAEGVVHAIAEETVPVVALAGAAARAAGVSGPVQPWPIEQARATLGRAYADALALDQAISGHRAGSLGWRPRGIPAVEDLSVGSYARPRAA